MAPRRREFNLQYVENLGAIQCTDTEVAVALGVNLSTVLRRADVQEALAKGRERGKTSLRRTQWQKALGQREQVEIRVNAEGKATETVLQKHVEPNVALLIWLGKQYLGQMEKAVVATGELPVIEIVERLGPHAPADVQGAA